MPNLIGQKFNMLTVISLPILENSKTRYLCKCDCGKEVKVIASQLTKGLVKSCGCLKSIMGKKMSAINFITHGMSGCSEYKIWSSMIQRCTNINDKKYPTYGAVGVAVCERWLHSFENFYADMGKKPNGLTLDRYPDKNGNYEPSNCRWATYAQQNRNYSRNVNIEINGIEKCLKDWCNIYGKNYSAVNSRRRKGMSPINALFA